MLLSGMAWDSHVAQFGTPRISLQNTVVQITRDICKHQSTTLLIHLGQN